MPLALQVKLLRFVQNKEFYRLGGNRLITVDVRIMAATSRPLEEMVERRAFRPDLFYRLNVLSLRMPPLRERGEDIVPLACHFLQRFNTRYTQKKNLSPQACALLEAYSWPGNIRELENLLERLVIINTGPDILPEHLPEPLRECLPSQARVLSGAFPAGTPASYQEARETFEKEYWADALRRYSSYREAAGALGVDHSTIVKKVARYAIKPAFAAAENSKLRLRSLESGTSSSEFEGAGENHFPRRGSGQRPD
jgi:DNA-binding NtrC family response regulator